jgi:hypothetical protein
LSGKSSIHCNNFIVCQSNKAIGELSNAKFLIYPANVLTPLGSYCGKVAQNNLLTLAKFLYKMAKERDAQTPTSHIVIPGGAVVYVGRIPHGFYEDEMRSYFSQFGDITRLRISRNKKTGASKHFGFIEFRHASVAKIAVETMHNYLLFGHLLQCKLVPQDLVHPETFKGANRKFRHFPRRLAKKSDIPHQQNTDIQLKRIQERKTKKQLKLSSKLSELGIQL